MERDAIKDTVSDNLFSYYQEYKAFGSSGDTGSGIYPCDYWIPWPEPQDYYPRPYTYYYYPTQVNKTEQAFKILKLLVEEKVIKEPGSFKKFCELIEKLAKVI